MVFCIDSVAGIMPIITCPGCNLTNTRFCHEKGFVENTRFCRKTGFIANTRLFGFVWCRLLRRHLGFDSDFAQISGLKIGGWQHCTKPILLLWALTLSQLGGGATDSRKSEAKSPKQRRCARAQVQGGQP